MPILGTDTVITPCAKGRSKRGHDRGGMTMHASRRTINGSTEARGVILNARNACLPKNVGSCAVMYGMRGGKYIVDLHAMSWGS